MSVDLPPPRPDDEDRPPAADEPLGEERADPPVPPEVMLPPLDDALTTGGETVDVPTAVPGRPGGPPVRRRGARRRYRSFDFGRVLSGTFAVYFKMLPAILVLALVIAGPVGILSVMTNPQLEAWESTSEPSDPWDTDADSGVTYDADGPFDESSFETTMLLFVGSTVLGLFAQMILTGAVAYLVVRHQQKRPVGIGEALGRGFSRFFPMLGAGFLVYLVVALMFIPALLAAMAESAALAIILMIGAFIPMILWTLSTFVTVPACAVERLGPVASIKRSRGLCIGYRWQIFGLSFVMGIIGAMIGGVFTVPFAASGNIHLSVYMQTAMEVLVATPLGAVMTALTYIELRAVTEGVDADGIAEVFS